MLKALFASETRIKALSACLSQAEKTFTAKSLAKDSSVGLAAMRKELLSLKDLGLLKLEGKDNYMVDKNFIIYPELRALLAKAQLLSSQKFIDGVKEQGQLKLLALTGFFTGDLTVKTDILLVGKVKRRPFSKLLDTLEKDLNHEINYTIIDESEFTYRRAVMDIFLYNILNGKTIFLVDEIREERERVEKEGEPELNLETNESSS